MKVEVLEKCYYGFRVYKEGERFEWSMPAWAKKEGLSEGKALPHYLIPVSAADRERVAQQRGEELPVREEQDDDNDDELLGSTKDAKIIEVAQSLDHSEETHWTQKGLPDVNAISEKAGFKVTRAEVSALLPDLVREEQDD